ncbi:hypothetical protein GCM10009867_27840 [Pedococcus aerophilus]|uniref:Uncharacterized protein n=1 Tax=Pedococcus aerophilus TaxID=436356 RepID=A0ABN3UUD3_9MICO
MGVLLRVLGLQALAVLVGTMPARTARALTLVMLVGANLFPLVALLTGAWQAGDVLVTYWLENVAVGTWQVVKLLTAQGCDPVTGRAGSRRGALETGPITADVNGQPVQFAGPLARIFVTGFFAVHYGIFTLVHGVFTFILARQSGTSGSIRSFALVFLVLLLSHGLSTAIHWFARGERRENGLMSTMKQPYGRILVLHVAVIGSFFLVLGPLATGGSASLLPGGPLDTAPASPSVLPGVLLIALKTVLDAVLHLRAHRTSRTGQVPATPDLAPEVAPDVAPDVAPAERPAGRGADSTP